ncbi:MAG: HAD family hydrolase [Chloroflexi bacterium]|nr:HAD family hydrolase [Chloroflexota bacterium]
MDMGRDMQIKGIIFDMDGTLLDSLGAYQQAFNDGVGRCGLGPATVESLAEKLNEGLNLEGVIVSLYPGHDDPSFLTACRQEIIAAFRQVNDGVLPVLPGARETLAVLSSNGLKLGVATGRTQPPDQVQRLLDAVGIGHFFEAIVTTAEVRERKPAPDAIFECARRLDLPPAECLVVGDSVADVDAGKAAGATVVGVLTGVANEARLAARGPAAIVGDLRELLALVENDGIVPSPCPHPNPLPEGEGTLREGDTRRSSPLL